MKENFDKVIGALVPGALDAPFWDAWNHDESFLLHRCEVCGRHDWPASCCPDHGRGPMKWVAASGLGVVDTFTIFYRAYTRELSSEVPYTIAIVRLDEGPYFHTRLVEILPKNVRSGMRVRIRKSKGDEFPLFVPE